MNNNELENIETVDLGGDVNPTIEPVVPNVEVPVQPETVVANVEAPVQPEPVVTNVEASVQNIPVTPEVATTTETTENVTNPQANVLTQIQPNVINNENNAEVQTSIQTSENENPESLGTIVTEDGEKVELTPVEVKSIKDTLIPLALLAVGLLAFILLIPKLSEIFNGM